MSTARDRSIYERLEHLAGYATVPDFAEAFYELIADYVSASNASGVQVHELFADYLAVEERYHSCLASLAEQESAAVGPVRDASEKREIGLRSLLEMLDDGGATGGAEIARVLLCAECNYHLGLTDQVVARLEAAVACGAEHPLVLFALGYNRYQLANEAFTVLNIESGENHVLDEDRYRLACLNSAAAFQEGLNGEQFDGQLHWWIGNVLRSAGFGDAAEASLRHAAEVIGAGLEWGDEDLAEFERTLLEDSGARAEPITAHEVAEAAVLLRRSFLPSELN